MLYQEKEKELPTRLMSLKSGSQEPILALLLEKKSIWSRKKAMS